MSELSAKMSGPPTETAEILSELAKHPDGMSLGDLQARLSYEIDARTLLRRLTDLISTGQVHRVGKTKGTRYILQTPAKKTAVVQNPNPDNPARELIPLSEAAKEILSLVSRPIEQRTPVSYQSHFLQNYQPNETFYLSAAERANLAETGITSGSTGPAGTYAKEILQRLLIDLSWNSSRLEGNTYSLLDTQMLLQEGKPATEKPEKDRQMILNHKEAIEFIVQSAEAIGINPYTIKSLHALLSQNLLPDPSASGRLRKFAIGISESVYIPLAVPQQIEELFVQLLHKAEAIHDPFEQAFFLMVHLPYLQPFDDVNKPVSRLAANIPLNTHNLAPLAFVDVPPDIYINGLLGVYEFNRVELLKDVFLWAHKRSALRYAALRQSLGEPDPLKAKYRDQLKSWVRRIVLTPLNKEQARDFIEANIHTLPEDHRERFSELVATELMSLHEGNIAIHWILPAEFEAWRRVWGDLA